MLNIYELLKLIPHTRDNHDAIYEIKEAFMSDFRRHYNGLHFNKSTRAAVIKTLENGAQGRIFKDEKAGVFATSYCLFFLNDAELAYNKVMDLSAQIKDFISDRRPVDCPQIIDSIAAARAMGWKPNADPKAFYIEIAGNYYDFNLIYPALMLITDKKEEYIRVELSNENNSKHPAVILSGKHGLVVVLPFLYQAGGVNVNIRAFTEFYDEIESAVFADIRKEA